MGSVSEIDGLRKRCEALDGSGDAAGWEKFYREEVFPTVAAGVAEQAEKDGLRGSYDLLVLTVGMTAEPLMLSIYAVKPKEVYFLYTEESKGKVAEVVDWCGLRADRFRSDIVGRSDALDIYERIKACWEAVPGNKKVAIDITGGTKPMVSGGGIAAALLGMDILYVDSQYGWLRGKSKPGTERLIKLRNPFDVFGDLDERQAVELFNGHNFTAAKSLFGRICSKATDPRRFEIYIRLTEAYEAWDCFRYGEAQGALKATLKLLKQYRMGSDKAVEALRLQVESLEVLKRSGTKSHFELMKGDEYPAALIADMFCNAKRRAEQGRYYDALIRLYRVIELISQYHLAARHGINTSDITIDDARLLEDFSRQAERLYGYRKDLPPKVGLMDGWLLLFLLQDRITGFSSLEDLKTLMEDLRVRNELMIEHMSNPGKRKDFNKLESIARAYAKKAVDGFEGMVARQSFIRLPL